MADTYYAWTTFRVNDVDDPNNPSKRTTIKPGDKVSASDLGVNDEEFQAYVDNGAIRKMQYPDMGDFGGSPVEFAKAQLAAQANEGGFFDTQHGVVDSAGAVLTPEESQATPAPQALNSTPGTGGN
jgi:hypothetical protein